MAVATQQPMDLEIWNLIRQPPVTWQQRTTRMHYILSLSLSAIVLVA